uniref:Uncharacterized protein n=1 Tax=Triticum urartu TaxID=4572 RepID=A0A8R7JXR2_TRIUA
MARLPSFEILSCAELRLGWVMGSSLLAIQTVVKIGILLNHMPRYQPDLEEVALRDDLLILLLAAGWKKPRVDLPFLETSLSPTASDWPAMRVSSSTAAERHQGVVCKRRRPSSM